MVDLIINPITQKQLDSAKLNLSHAYLFAGPRGLGKTTIAHKFARDALGPKATQGDFERWVMQVSPIEGKAISSSQTAEIRKYINSKKPEHIEYKAVIIDSAEHMSPEATNSLLLSLEEPATDTVIIMISDRPEAMLQTIISRLQKITFVPPGQSQLAKWQKTLNLEDSVVRQIGPYPGLLRELSEQGASGYQKLNEQADEFLEGNLSSRLMIASEISDKASAEGLIRLMSIKTKHNASIDQAWLKRANSLILAHIHLYNNGNPKFVLEKLALEFE